MTSGAPWLAIRPQKSSRAAPPSPEDFSCEVTAMTSIQATRLESSRTFSVARGSSPATRPAAATASGMAAAMPRHRRRGEGEVQGRQAVEKLVRDALRYYAGFPAEIDGWIAANARFAELEREATRRVADALA